MAITVSLCNMEKRVNSTKDVVKNTIKTVTGDFVEESSIFKPHIILSRDEKDNIVKFNYIKIAWPGDTAVTTRMYWVTDKVIMPDGRVKIEAIEDVFATCKSNILSESEYITSITPLLYDLGTLGTSGWSLLGNPNLPISPVKKINRYDLMGVDMFSQTPNDGFYVVGIIAQEVTGPASNIPVDSSSFKRGSVSYYVMTAPSVKNLLEKIKLQVGIEADYDLMKFIYSIIYYPIYPAVFNLSWKNQTQWLYFLTSGAESESGVNTVGFQAQLIDNTTLSALLFKNNGYISNSYTTNVQVVASDMKGDIPIAWDFWAFKPYTNVSLQCGLFGTMPIDLTKCTMNLNGDAAPIFNIKIAISIDCATGFMRISHVKEVESTGINNNIILESIDASIGIFVPIDSASTDSYITRMQIEENLRYEKESGGLGILTGVGSGALTGAAIGGVYGALAGGVIGGVTGIANYVVKDTNAENQAEINRMQASQFSVSSKGANSTALGWDGSTKPQIIVETSTLLLNLEDLPIDFLEFNYNRYVELEFMYEHFKSVKVKCSNPSLPTQSFGLTIEEISSICNQLADGLYIE